MYRVGDVMKEVYDTKNDVRSFDIHKFADNHHLWLCLRDGVPVGFMMATRGVSAFDSSITTLTQRLLFGQPGTRASHLLMREFVDFGKANVNHIYTVIGLYTNIKPKSLEKLGFRPLETFYRMEV